VTAFCAGKMLPSSSIQRPSLTSRHVPYDVITSQDLKICFRKSRHSRDLITHP